MVFLHVFNIFVRPQRFKDTVPHIALINGGIGIMLSCMSAHVFGQAKGLPTEILIIKDELILLFVIMVFFF